MADNLGVQFFTAAKAQYESAGKWRWIVVALLAYLHVGLVVPFAADTRDKAAVDRQLADNCAAYKALQPLLDAADKLAKDVKEAKDKAAADLKDDLVKRFKRLSDEVSRLAALGPDQAAGDEGVAPTIFSHQPLQQSQQQFAPDDPSALAPMSADLRRRIAETERDRPGEVSPELRPYIKSELIKPAFKHANEAWATSGLKIAQGGIAEIAEDIAKAKAAAPAAVKLDSLGDSVKALGDEAQRLTFKPPADPDWWRTVPGKEASIHSMTFNVDALVNDVTSSEKALTTNIADILSKNRQDAAALNDKIHELDKRATALQSQLGEIGGPLKVVAFKLSEIAPLMPLIIAATLAAIAAWTAQGLRRMILAARLVGDEADGTAIRTWLLAAAGGSRARVAGVELAVAIASVAWVLAAAWNVATLPPSFLTQRILAAIALAVVVAARIYHWRRADEAASAGERSIIMATAPMREQALEAGSSGSGVLRGTRLFDFDAGIETADMKAADVWWEEYVYWDGPGFQKRARQLVPLNGAAVCAMGIVNFESLTQSDLQRLPYSTTPIPANATGTNLLPDGSVFAVRSRTGNFVKVQVLHYDYDLQIRWQTPAKPTHFLDVNITLGTTPAWLVARYVAVCTYNTPNGIQTCARGVFGNDGEVIQGQVSDESGAFPEFVVVTVTIDFQPDTNLAGLTKTFTSPVTDTGVNFIFEPWKVMQKTDILFDLQPAPLTTDYLLLRWQHKNTDSQVIASGQRYLASDELRKQPVTQYEVVFVPDPISPKDLNIQIEGRYQNKDLPLFNQTYELADKAVLIRAQKSPTGHVLVSV